MTQIEKAKTLCCNAEWYAKGRADFRCKKCDKDVTLEIVLLYEAMEPVNQNQDEDNNQALRN